jgi:hypothetical protein
MDHRQLDALVEDTVAAREEFLAAIDAVDPELLATPGLIGDWSARELIAHVGYWAGHAVETIQAAEEGRAAEFGAGEPPVDEVNATVARVARETDLGTVRKREAGSFEALLTRLRRLEPSLLDQRLSDGTTLEQGIREDGADHYREHAADIRAWFSGAAEPDDDEDDEPEDDGEPHDDTPEVEQTS